MKIFLDKNLKLGELLIKDGLIDDYQLSAALSYKRNWGGRVGESLVRLGYLSEKDLCSFLTKQFDLPQIDLITHRIPAEILAYIPESKAREFCVIPIDRVEVRGLMHLVVAMPDPTNFSVIDSLQFLTECWIMPTMVSAETILKAIDLQFNDVAGCLDERGYTTPSGFSSPHYRFDSVDEGETALELKVRRLSEDKTSGQLFMQSKKKILIVDQEITYRVLLKEVLRDNYIVLESGDFNEGLDLARLNVPELIIIDSEVSDRKGVDLCAALKQHPETKDVPVLLVTSLANKEDIILGLQAGASDYITKPMCLQEVVARIESHLRTQDDGAELEHKDLMMLLELSETISVAKNPTEILRLIVSKITKIIDVTRCSVLSFTDGKKLVVKASSDFDNKREITLNLGRYPEIRKALETRSPVIINDIKNDPLMASVQGYLKEFDHNSTIVIPLIRKESVIGTFFLRTTTCGKNGISERIHRLCQLVANIAANALENAIIFESVKTAQEYFKQMSIEDALTKLYNRRYFQDRLKEEFSRRERNDAPLSLIFFDLDNFKRINDTHGHAQGDKVLIHIGGLLKTAARGNDLPARIGGDAFAMILPDTTAEGAFKLASRLCLLIKESKIENLDSGTISASMGISTCTKQNIESFDDLVTLADKAMYQSKSQGKGQVSQASGQSTKMIRTFVARRRN